MRDTEVAIIGGGMAGSTAAAMLGRAGIDAILIDPHQTYPADFRCEKLDRSQLTLLAESGVGDALLAAATPSEALWIARYGRVVERRVNHQVDALYDTMVNAMRAAIGGSAEHLIGKCTGLRTSLDRQVVTLASGEEISARLVILANGLNSALRRNMGLERREISPEHSIGIGFDIAPVDRPRFDFRALTYYPEHLSARMAYLSMFPLNGGTRANLFVYRDMRDPWLKAMREAPVATLTSTLPGLARLTGPIAITSFVNIRPVDLYVTTGIAQPGIVVIGDAYATSCPAAGTGLNKVLTDAVRLVKHHLPGWLATPGMGVAKIAAFYDDPIKKAADAWSAERAMVVRALATETGLQWRARRGARFFGQLGVSTLRAARGRVAARTNPPDRAVGTSGS